tara:strand:+ start:280 stop:1920 length:1641 start_codon:yes stop_codon:yes gene_type:complete
MVLVACNAEQNEPTATTDTWQSTFEALQSKLFEGQGCTNDACHGTASVGGLTLTADVAYDQLVEAASTGSDLVRVKPGDKSRSYLYAKLLAATQPDDVSITGGPMPTGGDAIPAELLDALRLWIYAGAPRTGTVAGTDALLGIELPPAQPITIAPLPAPETDDGFQLTMPPWTVPAGSEREVCFASYYDLRDSVPDEFKDETGDFAFVDINELRQDPQSHHLILNISRATPDDVSADEYGDWLCRGGQTSGQPCDPVDLGSCGEGLCATEPIDGFGCTGYGPPNLGGFRSFYPIGGAQKAQDYKVLPDGVYRRIPIHGVLYWNSHAFNLTQEDHEMNGRLNFMFAKNPVHSASSLIRKSAPNIFNVATPPFEKKEICAELVLDQGTRLFSLSSHTHKRGERFQIFHSDGRMLYENFLYNDPTDKAFSPPLEFDSDDPAERTLRYCALFNNGVSSDGAPDIETVTRYSRMPDSVNIPGVPGACYPTACVAGKVGADCLGPDDSDACDSAPGAGDGWCDACPITGGESTENEMMLLLGDVYIDPAFAN